MSPTLTGAATNTETGLEPFRAPTGVLPLLECVRELMLDSEQRACGRTNMDCTRPSERRPAPSSTRPLSLRFPVPGSMVRELRPRRQGPWGP